ncbi:MAG: methylenetetrahydrofolate reductase [NAD(P)H] [Solobacterium sp.]|nr:methylenetetrahydrofolate reductase [NAD(P)H] [Solobacterium sp.]
MRISDLLKQENVTISFEVFPPKKIENMETVIGAARSIAALHPDFISVTYGAAGTTREYTLDIAKAIRNDFNVTVLPHLTCVSSTEESVSGMLGMIRAAGIENVMVLRGDMPKDGHTEKDFLHASDLVRYIRERSDLCIGGACYPEGHIECEHKKDDISFLKEKVDAGCDFLTTQMYFDNNIYYNFLYRIREKGITVPVLPGIMPITNKRQLARSVALSGTDVPARFRAIVDHFGDHPAAMKQAGIIYASEQIVDLIANGVTHIHVYSMNKPDVAEGIMNNISALIR